MKNATRGMNARTLARQAMYELLRRPKLDPQNAEDLRLYSTDDLRRLYQAPERDPIRLRDGVVTRAEIKAVILWRLWWDRFGYFVLAIGAIAAVVAAIEGWHG
jgi:hypothetical protein